MMLEEALDVLEKRRYDVAVFLAEQALQLYLKAQLYRLLGDYPRTHSIRQLLALLAQALSPQAVERVREYTRRRRPLFSELEDVYIAARYTPRVYTEEDARDIVSFVREVIGFVEELLGDTSGTAEGEEEAAGGLGEDSSGGSEGGQGAVPRGGGVRDGQRG